LGKNEKNEAKDLGHEDIDSAINPIICQAAKANTPAEHRELFLELRIAARRELGLPV
jgi:hypothetical protein